MFSVIVTTRDSFVHASASPEAVARTLAALVPGAVAGVIRDVVMTGRQGGNQDKDEAGSRDLERIADHAGCTFTVADTWLAALRAGVKLAREPRIFVLRAGFAPDSGFYDELSDMARETPLSPARLLQRPVSALHRTLPFLSPLAGVAAERDKCLRAEAPDFTQWARRIGRMQTLRTRARRVD